MGDGRRGGGGLVTGGMNMRAVIFCIHDTSAEPYSFMKIILTVLKIESIAA